MQDKKIVHSRTTDFVIECLTCFDSDTGDATYMIVQFTEDEGARVQFECPSCETSLFLHITRKEG